MTLPEFFQSFTRIDVKDMERPIGKMHGKMNLLDIYKRLRKVEDQMLPLEIESTELLKVAEEYLSTLPKPRIDYRD